LADKKIKVGDLARQTGVSQPAISRVIHGQMKSTRIRQAIADAIGRPVAEVFPNQESS
jgi:transcriptional regulator with XRE-family HTH domain